MARHRDRYHQAARDNYLDMLREATSSECDAADEGGMTPVMWAAFYGHVEALRVLMGRGGDPDRTDHMGSTALHFAALNGHMNCVTYLVNFGANIWSLDVDYHSALDLAGVRGHQEIVEFLDSVAAREIERNKRTVMKRREKAAVDARRRAKKLEKLMCKADKKLSADRNLTGERAELKGTNPNYQRTPSGPVRAVSSSSSDGGGLRGGSASSYGSIDAVGTTSDPNYATADRPSSGSGRSYSDYITGSRLPAGATVPRLPRTSLNVTYSTMSSLKSQSHFSPQQQQQGLFERPGFGNSDASAASALAVEDAELTATTTAYAAVSLASGSKDSGTADSDENEVSDLSGFLASLSLENLFEQLTAERLDLDALALCGEADLRDIGLPLGPRKRLLEAIGRRRKAFETPQGLTDLRF